MDDFGRELDQSVREVLAFLDGKLALRVQEAVLPREVRKALGLAPAEMAERLGMDLGAYLAWEGRWVEVRNEWAFCEPPRKDSPAELLEKLAAARARGVCWPAGEGWLRAGNPWPGPVRRSSMVLGGGFLGAVGPPAGGEGRL